MGHRKQLRKKLRTFPTLVLVGKQIVGLHRSGLYPMERKTIE